MWSMAIMLRQILFHSAVHAQNVIEVIDKNLCKMSTLYSPAEIELRMAGAGISLQDLSVRFQLSQALLDEEVSEEHLRETSRIIEDHEIIGPELGLTTQEMTAICSSSQGLQRLKMLNKWKQKCVWNATYRQLIEAFLKCGRGDHARDLCQLLTQSKR